MVSEKIFISRFDLIRLTSDWADLYQKGLMHGRAKNNKLQGLQISLMSGVSLTSASQILESFWNIWSQVADFPACGPGMYTLSWGIHEVAVAVRWPGKLKSMMAVIE